MNTAADRLAHHALTAERIDPRRCQEIVGRQLGYDPGAAGHLETRLVLLRVGAGSDRDRVASEVRRRYGPGCALVSHDDISHLVLGVRDEHSSALIAQIASFALDAGQHVLCDSPWHTARDQRALVDLAARHRGPTRIVQLGGSTSVNVPSLLGVDEVCVEENLEHAVDQILDDFHGVNRRTA